jgi:hypothetical protein
MKTSITFLMSAAFVATFLGCSFPAKSAETNISGVASYFFEPNPQKIKPQMYNWEVKLSAADSTNGNYEIIQITKPLVEDGTNRATTKVLIGISPMSHEETIRRNDDGIIDFMLYVGDKEPPQNMNGPGKINEPIIFSGIGTGVGMSDGIVLPGSKIDQVVPSDKGTEMSDGKLQIIQFFVTNNNGEKFQADVILRCLK